MVGKKGKSVKRGSVKQSRVKHLTKGESLSKVKEDMGKIVEGDDPRHHLR